MFLIRINGVISILTSVHLTDYPLDRCNYVTNWDEKVKKDSIKYEEIYKMFPKIFLSSMSSDVFSIREFHDEMECKE